MIRLCSVAQARASGILRVAPPGLPPIAVYHLGATFLATDDRCSHGDASLSTGMIEGRLVVCPLHFGSFDIATGEAVDPPCTRGIRTHKLLIRDGEILLDTSG